MKFLPCRNARSGVFSFQDGLSLVIQRAKVLSDAASDQAGVFDQLICC